jgi:hypothetical protein
MIDPSCVWMDGELVGGDDVPAFARDPANTVALEVMHCTETSRGTAVFRLRDHLERFLAVAEMAGVQGYPHTPGRLFAAVHKVIHANGCLRCQAQIQLVWKEPHTSTTRPITLISMRRGEGHRTSAMHAGTKVSFSDLQNSSDVFWVQSGVLNVAEMGVYPGSIARDSLITLAEDASMRVLQASPSREQLLRAEEVFQASPPVDVMPVTKIDGKPIASGKPGPLTQSLQERLEAAAHGRGGRVRLWLETLDETIYAV